MGKSRESAGLPLMSAFWLVAWSVFLSVMWLLPNHYLPWAGFHFDFGVASVLAIAAAAVLIRSPGDVAWHRAAVLVGMLVLLPWVQQAAGMVNFIGTTWIGSAYLLGLLLALLIGARWETASPGQLGDGLFLAIGLAALVSVGLQLHQWFGMDSLEVWIMPDHFGRPFANFGQPNQLATFLLWGLLALSWGWVRGHISAPILTLAALYLLFGLAMTHSRTGWLASVLLVGAVWFWRRQWPSTRTPWLVTALAICFFIFVASLGTLREFLLLAEHHDLVDPIRMQSETRPTIWALFVDAALRHPWRGYGWNQTLLAQLEVAVDHPSLASAFSYAHNLFLDLIIWCGIPLGLGLSFALVAWMWRCVRRARNAEDVLLVLFLLLVLNHAMLELPLYYAYMLLPVGLVAGMLNARLGASAALHTGRGTVFGIWLIGLALLGLILGDYAKVEPAYEHMRYVQARIRTPAIEPLDVRLLTQLQAHLHLIQLEAINQVSDEELDNMRKTVAFNPAPVSFQKLAAALALNGHPEEAGLWLRRLCKVTPDIQCQLVRRAWVQMSLQDPRIAAVPWPN